MALRQYTISVIPRNPDVGLNPAIIPQFGCCISDPSGFVQLSSKRGLAYTDTEGNAINHPTFVHLAYIPNLAPGITEEMQIQELVYDKLGTVYHLNKYHEVEVQVTRKF